MLNQNLRRKIRWLVGLTSIVASATGCTTQRNPRFCGDGICIDPTYPFCDIDAMFGDLQQQCVAVECAPDSFVACRGDDELRCNATGTNYDVTRCEYGCDDALGGCARCTSHSQCPTGICKTDGSCARELEITYVDPSGSETSDCSRENPCTLARALELPAPVSGQLVQLSSGIHQSSDPFIIRGHRSLVGMGSTHTIIKATNEGAVISIDAGSQASLERLAILEGVFAGDLGAGKGIDCPATPPGPRSVKVIDADVSNNANVGLFANGCSVEVVRSNFSENYSGIEAYNGTIKIDRSSFSSNGTHGVRIGGVGDCIVTNSFMYRNQVGISITACSNSTRVDFNTIVDNWNLGFECGSPSIGMPLAPANNLIARNQTNIQNNGTPCTHVGSLISNELSELRFRSPNSAPYDYHITSGSIAINAASNSTLAHDFDGELRPLGGVRDIGADEAE